MKKTVDQSSSVKLRNNPEKLYACYKGVTVNIQELEELGEIHAFIVVDRDGQERLSLSPAASER